MKLERNEIRVAIFVLIPLAMLVIFVLFKLGYSIAGSTMDVYLKIDSISSIKKGTLVKIKGYTVGRVASIIPVYKPALHFLAVLRMERGMEFYEDCTAIIQNQNIIGDPMIELRNPEKMGEELAAGSVIEGIEYVNLEVILQDVHKLLATVTNTVGVFKDITLDSKNTIRVLLDNLSATVMTFNQLLSGSQKDILEILQSFRQTATTMKDISEEFKRRGAGFLFGGSDEKEKKKK
jgi:ABC-type transporter Mla subunit MlaD